MTTDEFAKWALLVILGGFVALLQWNAKRLQHKVDTLEKDKASIKSLDELKSEMRDHRQETREGLREINSHLLTIVGKLK